MEKGFYAFGTMNFIRIDSQLTAKQQEAILTDAQAICARLDDLLSAFKPDSDIGKINTNAGVAPVYINKITFQLLQRSLYFAKASNGAFDITIRPAVNLWQIGKPNQHVPSQAEYEQIKPLVNYKNLILDAKNQTAFLEKKGQSIDLGGIAKGFAGDYVRTNLQDKGITSALMNFGGTILAIGHKTAGTAWKAGIQHPLRARGEIVGSVMLPADGVLVTSGVNERFFIEDSIRYHHLLDPHTCQPARSGVLSVTAAGTCGMDLDAATTALFVLGTKEGIALANRLNIEALYLTEAGKIIATKGFANGKYKFQPEGDTHGKN